METVMWKASSIRPRSPQKPQGKHTLDSDTAFKVRYRNHVSSFRNERYKHATELSKYISSLKDKNAKYNIKWCEIKQKYNIKWRKIKQASSYSNITKRCNLCLWEKYFIICKPEMASLNKRNELSSCCRHVRKFLLRNVTM